MEIVFFNTRSKKFFKLIRNPLRPQVDGAFRLLEEYNHNLGMPFSKPLGGKLFELRIIDIIHLRFIYTFYSNRIWILHGFVKKTERISKQDIEYARKQLRMLLH